MIMPMKNQLTAIIELESDGYIALCLKLDFANQSDEIE